MLRASVCLNVRYCVHPKLSLCPSHWAAWNWSRVVIKSSLHIQCHHLPLVQHCSFFLNIFFKVQSLVCLQCLGLPWFEILFLSNTWSISRALNSLKLRRCFWAIRGLFPVPVPRSSLTQTFLFVYPVPGLSPAPRSALIWDFVYTQFFGYVQCIEQP